MYIIQDYHDHSVDEAFSCHSKRITRVYLCNRNWFTSWVQDLRHLILDVSLREIVWGDQSCLLAWDYPGFSTGSIPSWETPQTRTNQDGWSLSNRVLKGFLRKWLLEGEIVTCHLGSGIAPNHLSGVIMRQETDGPPGQTV